MASWSPDQILNGDYAASELHEKIPVSVVMVCEFIDKEDGVPYLAMVCSENSTTWHHLGMLQAAVADMVKQCKMDDTD